jgi:hypothetical protein
MEIGISNFILDLKESLKQIWLMDQELSKQEKMLSQVFGPKILCYEY